MRGEASRRAMSGGSNISERSELVADSRPYRGNQSSGKGQTQAPCLLQIERSSVALIVANGGTRRSGVGIYILI